METKRRAVVTGAASGIGRAIAAKLVTDGHDVLSVDLDPDPGGPGVPFAADLTTADGNRASIERAIEEFDEIDLLVPCAGFQHVAPIAGFPEDQWAALLGILLTSPSLLAKYAWDSLKESGRGQIVVIASVHGLVASPFKAGYVAAKHGVVGLTKVLALEGGPHGIRAVALCPGYVRTPLVEGQIPDQARAHGMSEDQVLTEMILAPHAVKELVEPEEVADTVAFLLTPAGRAFTGVALPMDMGWSAR
ncbi:MAG TPA: SDR family oxidoreductase [Acidimicrobiia bacterium]|nr:SDR family oxidoreductase [Acidimicrobiia bacterium]